MGALAQLQVSWMPEDDFQLKNAIEGGASLECLAKGAVQFSRRFSLQEIKERWVSILYDPVISAEVAVRVMEVERNSSNLSHKSKSNGKRNKTKSVRDHYYAARKRMRYENCRSMEMELADGQFFASDFNNGIEPPLNCNVGDLTFNQFEHQQLDAGLMDHRLSQVKVDVQATSCTGAPSQPFHPLHNQFIRENLSFDQGSLSKETPQVFGEASLLVDCFQVENMGILENVNMCDANGLPVDPQSLFDTGNLLDDFDALLPDCGLPSENLDFPSPLPEISMWDAIDDISAPMMPVEEQNHGAGEKMMLQSLDASMPDLDAGPAESQTAIQNQGGDIGTPDSDEFLAELYNLLDDELTVLETDDQPSEDNSFYEGLSSLLANSPIDADGDQNNLTAGPVASLPSDLSQRTMDGINPIPSCIYGAFVANESLPFPLSESLIPNVPIPSDCQLPVESNSFASCVLSTEDPDVPNVDDIVLPQVSVSVKDLLGSRNHSETNKKNLGKPNVFSKAHICQPVTGKSRNHTVVDCNAPNNLPKVPGQTKGEHTERVISRGLDYCINNGASHLDANGLCNNLDNRLGKTLDDHALSRREYSNDLSAQDPLTHSPHSDSGEPIQESDEEIPYYSDVEEMVLEMDLEPIDQDNELKEKVSVSKYRSQNAMKEIIRLEQAAHSFTQRAVARRGALAVIYGRHSKHYIMKSEVLLGRRTDDFHVDIDLGAEGRAHKVSRRQAVIKLEADGKFYIKNLGKWSIYKNNLEVAAGQIVRLQSGNLIEIQRMAFIFEDNPLCVRRHLRTLQKPMKPIDSSQKPPE